MKILALTLLLGSCAGNPNFHYRADKLISLRASAGVASGELTATTTIGYALEQDSVSDSGSAMRFDISRKFRKGALEVGVFYGTNDIEYGLSQVEVQDFGIVSRSYLFTPAKLRPYIECRLGGRQQSMLGAAPGEPGETSGTALIFGLGLGAEYFINDSFAVFLQLDGAYAQGSQGSSDLMTTETAVMIGGVFRF